MEHNPKNERDDAEKMNNHYHLEEIFFQKKTTFQKIQQLTQNLPDVQANIHISDSKWSISEILEHLAVSENQLLQLIESMLKKTEKAGKSVSEKSPSEILVKIIFERSKGEKYKTRDEFLPTGKLPILVSLQLMQNIQTKLNELKARLESADLNFAVFPHWIFGRLNLGQWLTFLGYHEERHLAQIKAILDSIGFTQAALQPALENKEDLKIVRTNSADKNFIELVKSLDADLQIRDGDDHPFFAQYNKLDNIKFAVVAYWNGVPAGCGAIKQYDNETMEVKRMFVNPELRGKGIAAKVLLDLENWAEELNFKKCILETGKKQPEAIILYQKNGYKSIPNFGQYQNVESSVCFEKILNS